MNNIIANKLIDDPLRAFMPSGKKLALVLAWNKADSFVMT